MIPNMIIQGVITILQKQFKLDKLMSYVFEQNELDDRCDELEDKVEGLCEDSDMCADNMSDALDVIESLKERVSTLEANAHPPRDFVVCDKCKQKIKEKE